LPYNEEVGEKLRAAIPHAAALRLPRAGHMANMEQPDHVNRAISHLAEQVFNR
jgi:pimeloyl-ACP methyl ester carboxylesterase